MSEDLLTWVCHESRGSAGLPADPPLGEVMARDRYDAQRLARRQWPGKAIVVQRAGYVLTETHVPRKKRRRRWERTP